MGEATSTLLATSQNSSNRTRSWGTRLRSFGLLFVIAAAIVLSIIYKLQPDFLAPVTMVPCLVWLAAMLLVVLFCLRGTSNRIAWASIVSVLLFGIFFVEEVRSFTRFHQQEVRAIAQRDTERNSLRVVTVNCNIGSLKCARETKELFPDIVVLQESPGREVLTVLADELFGETGQVVSSGDTSILFSGEVVTKLENKQSHYTQTNAHLRTGTQVAIVSARLSPPVYRLDFWNRKFWDKHAESRRKHREQLTEIRQSLANIPAGIPTIIAGDFNSVAHDGAFDVLASEFADAFQINGLGWGATGTNDFPVFRVDQIWTNNHLVPQSVVARKTKHSDHRMVVGDFVLKSK